MARFYVHVLLVLALVVVHASGRNLPNEKAGPNTSGNNKIANAGLKDEKNFLTFGGIGGYGGVGGVARIVGLPTLGGGLGVPAGIGGLSGLDGAGGAGGIGGLGGAGCATKTGAACSSVAPLP
ncbi:hypothetical protein MRB53_003735 [Persea americana]|uniref:Uncharacterized protein n=1 Tax=Persea americana TaxID=3435 RepID=A0ACC2MY24_PERAE|nr:hypothetical protein MRB53_003735 [Persea americana]